MAAAPIPKFVGERIRRREDPRLILGKATYVDDVHLAGMLSAAILRSPHAHARIKSIRIAEALKLDGVIEVTTGEDLRGKVGSLPCAWPVANRPFHPVLALDKVRFVGEPVAIVVARDAYLAHDALELIEVDYEPLPAVTDPEKALAPDAPLIHEQFGTNIVQQAENPSGLIDELIRQADTVIRFRFANQRLVPMSMETRGVLASWDAAREELVLWSSTQMPHIVRSYVAEMIGLAENQLRVIAAEVGGGFGAKSNVYREEALLAFLARKLGRPVKWIEQRREHLATLTHGRGQVAYVEAAVKRDGTILGIRARLIGDMGAYLHLLTPMVPGLTGLMLPNTYKLRATSFTQQLAFTNKMSTDTYRGAGLPEAVAIIERVIDLAAAEFDLDPAEVRRRNLVEKDKFPWTTATGLIYDSGNYEAALDRTLQLAEYGKLRHEQTEARKQGRCVGIGLSCFAEMTGVGPSTFFPGLKVGGWESATVRIEPDCKVTVLTGSSSHGQGHETSFAQITADALGVEVEDVTVVHGDTGRVQYGIGTFASRSMAVGGAALMGAIGKLKEKLKKIASFMTEIPPEQMTFAQRTIAIGSTARSIPLQKVVDAAYQFRAPIPGLEPGLEATHFFEPPNCCTSFGAHACMVEVDPETGAVRFLKYVAVYDCGTVINPLIVEGQVHGGTVQAIGQALCEEVRYDEGGQLITGSLMDYALPRAEMIPRIEVANTVTTTPLNPLGAKGMGESGCIGGLACVVNAVLDALQPFGIKDVELPLNSERIWRAMQDAKRTR